MNSERFIEVSVRSSRVHTVQIRLTHWGRDRDDRHYTDTVFVLHTFLQWNSLYFYCFRNMFAGVQLIIIQYWFRQWPGTEQVTGHHRNQWWSRFVNAYLDLNESTIRKGRHLDKLVMLTDFGKCRRKASACLFSIMLIREKTYHLSNERPSPRPMLTFK